MRERKHSKEGWRVLVGAKVQHPESWSTEGSFVRKIGNQPAWPFVILLDSGQQVELDEWQFEFVGPPTDAAQPVKVQPVQQPQQQDQSESEEEMAARVAVFAVEAARRAKAKEKAKGKPKATAAAAERVKLKPEVVPVERVQLKRDAKAKTRARSNERAPVRGKTTKGKALKMPWTDAILKVMDGRKGVKLPEIYAGVKKLIGEPNANFTATVRQSLQSMAKQGRTRMARPGVWDALKQKA